MSTLFQRGNLFSLAVLLLLVFLPSFASPSYLFFATDALIAALLAISLNLLVGYGGLVSFGHAAYYGIGAYTCALLMKNLQWSFTFSLIAGVILAVIIAAIAGFFCVRLTKVYFSMLTLAFSQIIWAICFRWNEVTGGDQGTSGIPTPDFSFIKQLPGMAEVEDGKLFYFLVLIIVSGCAAFALALTRSPFGRILIATRENPQRCTFIGLNVRLVQLVTFCIAAALAGVAGGLFGVFNRGVYPDFLIYSKGAEILIMVLLGGSGSFWGPALGAAALLWLHQESTAITEYWGAILGIILAVLTLVFPGGLVGIVALIKRKFFGKGGQV